MPSSLLNMIAQMVDSQKPQMRGATPEQMAPSAPKDGNLVSNGGTQFQGSEEGSLPMGSVDASPDAIAMFLENLKYEQGRPAPESPMPAPTPSPTPGLSPTDVTNFDNSAGSAGPELATFGKGVDVNELKRLGPMIELMDQRARQGR